MNNEINFFDFCKLLWSNKSLIISITLLLSLMGIGYDYYRNTLAKHYQATLIIYPLTASELIKIERIKIASENVVYKRNGCSGLGCNFRDDWEVNKDYLIDFSNSANLADKLLEEFYIKFMSRDRRLKAMKAVNYLENISEIVSEFERENTYVSDYKDNFYHNFLTDNFQVSKVANEKILILLKHSDYEKLFEFLDYISTDIIKEINLEYEKIINKSIKNLEQDKITQEKALETQLKKLEYLSYPKKEIIRYGINQKITFMRIDFLIERIKNALEFSGIKDMTFKPVQYDSSGIAIEQLHRYKINYPFLGFFSGIFISILIIVIRRSYLIYKDENLVKEKE